MKEKIKGIYTITNIKNKKVYVGRSVDINTRWKLHKRGLLKNTHENLLLQRSFNKYGEEYFIYQIIELVDKEELLIEREQYWMDFLKSYNRKIGFNINTNASGGTSAKHYVLFPYKKPPILIYNLTKYCRENKLNKHGLFRILENVTEFYKGCWIREATKKEVSENQILDFKRPLCNWDEPIKYKNNLEIVKQYGFYFFKVIYPNGLTKIKYSYEEAVKSLDIEFKKSSIYRGVYFDKQRFRWCANTRHNKKPIHIGYYYSQKEAALAYNQKALELHKEKAKLNNIKDSDFDIVIEEKGPKNSYKGKTKYYVVFPPNCTPKLIYNKEEYCRENDLQSANLTHVIKGKYKHYKGYWIREATREEILQQEVLDFNKPILNIAKKPNNNLPKYIQNYKLTKYKVQIKGKHVGIYNSVEEAIKSRDNFLSDII